MSYKVVKTPNAPYSPISKPQAQVPSCQARLNPVWHLRTVQKEARKLQWLHASQLPRLSHYSEYHVQPVAQEEPFALLLSGLVTKTVEKHRKSYHSKEYCPPPILVIVAVRSVVNPRLQAKYVAKLQDLEGKRKAEGCSEIGCLAHLKLPVGMHDMDSNEHILFHGAPPAKIERICKGGFDPQRGGEATAKLFGVTTYFATNSSKSDDYTENKATPLSRSHQRTPIRYDSPDPITEE